MIDFEISEETKLVRNIVREFVHEVCIPAEKELTVDTYDEILAGLRQKARGKGLWCPFSQSSGVAWGSSLSQMHWYKWNWVSRF